MFNPTEETRQTINWSDSSYDLVNRGGWVSKSPLRRQSVRMIPDGAVFKSDSKPKGRLVNVLDPLSPALTENQRKFLELFGLDHPVYRDGRAFFIPIGS
jgi:CRISPR/Cas system CSM-associated protein Csm4 (group 5 of RAMP superfamily)